MNTVDLKKILSVSCAGHIAAFALLAPFGFSLGHVRPHQAFTPVVFCGTVFPQTFAPAAAVRPILLETGAEQGLALEPSPAAPIPYDHYIKPASVLPFEEAREPVEFPPVFTAAPERKDPGLLMHPLLPYQFDLYFNDRQTVHIELEFEITRANDRNFVSLRRKISSGNLEADLLSMRYIEHYLFIQQARFMPDTWQTVKIEFSPHNR